MTSKRALPVPVDTCWTTDGDPDAAAAIARMSFHQDAQGHGDGTFQIGMKPWCCWIRRRLPGCRCRGQREALMSGSL